MRSDLEISVDNESSAEKKKQLEALKGSLKQIREKYDTLLLNKKNQVYADAMAVWNEAQRLLSPVQGSVESSVEDKQAIDELINYFERIKVNPGFLSKNTTLGQQLAKLEKKPSAPVSNLRASTIFVKENEGSMSVQTNVGVSEVPSTTFPENIYKDFISFYKEVSKFAPKSWYFSYPLTNGEVMGRNGIGEWQNKMMVVSPSVKESLDAKKEKIEPDLSIEDLNKRTEDFDRRVNQVYLAVARLGGMKDFLRDTQIEGFSVEKENKKEKSENEKKKNVDENPGAVLAKNVDAVLAALDQLVAKADKDPKNQFLLKEWLMANGGQEMNRFFDGLLYNDKEFSEGDLSYAPTNSKGTLGNWTVDKDGKLEFELACNLYDLTGLHEDDPTAIPFIMLRDRNGDVRITDQPINIHESEHVLDNYLPLIQYHAKAQLEIVDGKVKPKITYLEVAAFGTDALLSPQRKFGAPEQKVESKEEVKSTTTYTPKM